MSEVKTPDIQDQEVQDFLAMVNSPGWKTFRERLLQVVESKKEALVTMPLDKLAYVRAEILGMRYSINLVDAIAKEMTTPKISERESTKAKELDSLPPVRN